MPKRRLRQPRVVLTTARSRLITPMEAQALAVAKEAGDLQVSIRGLREPETKDAAGISAVNEKTAAVTHLQDATGILGTQRPAAKTVITYQGAAVAPVTF